MEKVEVKVRELHLTFACTVEGEGNKCPKTPPFSCIEPVMGACPHLVAVDSLARSMRKEGVG